MKRIYLITALILLLSISASGQMVIGSGGQSEVYEIEDDYSTDTTANYTRTEGDATAALSISGGKLHQSISYKGGGWYHETSLSSTNHYVQADLLNATNTNDRAGLKARHNGTDTYYYVRFNGDTIYLYRSIDGTRTYLDDYNGSYVGGAEYNVKLSVSGTGETVNVTVDVDGTQRINYSDISESRIISGSYIGIELSRSSQDYDVTIDNLIADSI
jgi:hypothetical protein